MNKNKRKYSRIPISLTNWVKEFTQLQKHKSDDGYYVFRSIVEVCAMVGITQVTFNKTIKRGYITTNVYNKLLESKLVNLDNILV